MYYGDKRESRVALYHALVVNGWKCYGYKPDKSDSMTDYYSPADWKGLATKNEYILVIDQYSTSYSGYEVIKNTYNPKTSANYDKINKLKNMTAEKGCTLDEEKAAQEMIERLQEKAKPQKEVLEVYPSFKNANPDNCNWHIEDENGVILEKGTGAFAFNGIPYNWDYSKKQFKEGHYYNGQSYEEAATKGEKTTIKKLYDFIDKIEKTIKNPKYCYVPDIKKGYKTVIKPFEIDTPSEIKEGQYFILKGGFVGKIKGDVYKITSMYKNHISANRLNKKLEKVLTGSANNANSFSADQEKLLKWIEKGYISFVELREVQDETSKPILKKITYCPVNKPQKENAETIVITGEVTEVTEQTQEVTKVEINADFEVKFNEEKNGIELHFTDKPNEEVRTLLKENGFRWSKYGKFWYAKDTQERRGFVKSIQEVGKVTDVKQEQVKITEQDEAQAESILDYSTQILTRLNLRHYEYENNEGYKKELAATLKEKGYKITNGIIEYLKINNYDTFARVLMSLCECKNKTSRGNMKQEKTEPKNDNSKLIEKIDNSIQSLHKQLDNISGDYLVNTRKRLREENNRQQKRDRLKQDIKILIYIKEKANSNISDFEKALLISAFRDDMRSYCIGKYKYNRKAEYPSINPNWDKNSSWSLDIQKKIKRFQKCNIFNATQLDNAIEQYKLIIDAIDNPADQLKEKIRQRENELKMTKIEGYFPTPKSLVERMIDLADVKDTDKILEPSAGNGNIIDVLVSQGYTNIDCIEWNYSLSELLKMKKYNLVENDFLKFNNYESYDKIIMNPPFESLKDIDHVKHAYNCLKEGGRIVAIMSESPFFRSDKKSVEFREWLSCVGYSEKLPDGSFKESGTGVNTRIIIIDKVSNSMEEAI